MKYAFNKMKESVWFLLSCVPWTSLCCCPVTTSAWRVNALCCCCSGFSLHSHSGEASRPLRVSSCDRYFCFSRPACSCRGCVCRSRWLPYNIKECERRSCPILHTRMVPPTHTFCFCITLSLSCTFLFASHSLSYSFCSPCSPLLLWFLPRWLFCWQAPAGCHGSERGGILSV